MAVNPSVPAKTVPEFIAYAKANPGKVNMGSAGTGGIGHLAGEQFKMMTGIDMTHVPYRGNGPALTGLLGGEVQVLFPSLGFVARVRVDRQAARARRRQRARAPTSSRRCRPSPSSFRASRPARGMASAHRRTRRRRSSTEVNTEIDAALADPQIEARFAELGDVPRADDACRVRQVYRRRNREVAQGGEVRRRQAGVKPSSKSARLATVSARPSIRAGAPAAARPGAVRGAPCPFRG